MGRDRDRPLSSRDRETVDDFVDANTVDRMHRRTRSRRSLRAHTNQRSARSLVAVVSHCHALAMR